MRCSWGVALSGKRLFCDRNLAAMAPPVAYWVLYRAIAVVGARSRASSSAMLKGFTK